MPIPDNIHDPKFWVSLITLVVGIVGGAVAYMAFRRNEKWKRAEFLADEIEGVLP